MPTPDTIYISPFRRTFVTNEITFRGWFYADDEEPGMEMSNSVTRMAIEVCTKAPG